ncbi:activator-dependent family glycosyltransferase [Streptomyces anulatus]|uniref:activator-dependent family glycosyltransferase n=1 Tax=Streptomyces anulatus TaxID=1892 RepID=UPI002258F8AB|nr:activator-dependent family glycosyltransferase [Streptomyces anulatus]MCX4483288.1 activator-dependent family glycosyltransferase [Streptomyces anulatus]
MRVLILTLPMVKSHLYVLAPLAWALRSAGHEVRVACQSDLTDAITAAGLTAVPVGVPMSGAAEEVASTGSEAAPPPRPLSTSTPLQADYGGDDPWAELDSAVNNFLRHCCPDQMLDDLVGFARSWRPDLVLWDWMTYAGAIAARACGAAHARVLGGTDAVVQLREAWRSGVPGDTRQDPMRAWLEPLLDRYGCAFTEEAVTGQWTVDTQPEWAWSPGGPRRVPVRQLAYNGPSAVPRDLEAPPERPRVCVTMGGSQRGGTYSEASPAALLEAVADLDVEVIATFTAADLRGHALPDNVRTYDYVPLSVLLPSCAAVVHHGGFGTMVSALESGVPQLVVPGEFWSNKWYGPVAYANGLQERGAGVYVADSDRLTPDLLRTRLKEVLDNPSYREAAELLRLEALGRPTPSAIVPTLEQLTAAHSTAARSLSGVPR